MLAVLIVFLFDALHGTTVHHFLTGLLSFKLQWLQAETVRRWRHMVIGGPGAASTLVTFFILLGTASELGPGGNPRPGTLSFNAAVASSTPWKFRGFSSAEDTSMPRHRLSA